MALKILHATEKCSFRHDEILGTRRGNNYIIDDTSTALKLSLKHYSIKDQAVRNERV